MQFIASFTGLAAGPFNSKEMTNVPESLLQHP